MLTADALAQRLPDWTATNDPANRVDLSGLVPAVLALRDLSAADRRALIAAYSAARCYPTLDYAKGSGLYLALRVLFALPPTIPMDRAKNFGGWHHPSISAGGDDFAIAWPVRIDAAGTVHVAAFTGYFGRGWNALAEYDYFTAEFPLRARDALAKLVVSDVIDR